MKSSPPFLSVCLTAGYRNKPAVLKNLFLQMREGEILGLVGQSGSGKSTLTMSILGLLNGKAGVVEGSAYLRGRNLIELSERDMRARLEPGSGIPPGPTAPATGLFLVSVEYD